MTCKSNVFPKKTLIHWSLKPSCCLLLFSAACLQLRGAGTAPCLPDPVRLSVSPLAAASSKAMSCHALLPLELRPAKARVTAIIAEQEPPVRD